MEGILKTHVASIYKQKVQMRLFTIVVVFATVVRTYGQLSTAHQKALNAYAAYANRVGEEYTAVVQSTFKHFEVVNGKYPNQYRYTCPFQMEDYFLNSVSTTSKNLPASVVTSINAAFQNLQAAERKVDKKCKELDTYYKLEDYKRDNYAQARQLIEELESIAADFWKAHRALQRALESAQKNVQGPANSGTYFKVDQRLHEIIETERKFLDNWKLNFNHATYSGWSTENLHQSIAQSAAALETLKAQQPVLKYPASSMYTHFLESYGAYLEIKRTAMDEHNFQASQNDVHNNDVYLNFINYFNGTLVSDYNTFLQFSERDGYYGVNRFKYVPAFAIVRKTETTSVAIKPYENLPYQAIAIQKQKTAITNAAFRSLTEYVEFINETYYQVRSLHTTLTHFNGDANYYWNISDYTKRQPMRFDLDKFQVPLSYYQKVETASKALPPTLAQPLNTQAKVILNILQEMEAVGAAMAVEVQERRYEKDRLQHLYELLERQHVLLAAWDEKKEKLYSDLRLVFDAYPAAQPSSSWQVSGLALRNLIDLDHAALFEAKAFYNGDSTRKINTATIESKLREILTNEYENMKGIEKLGRYNGNCPYSPYEDVPKNSRTLAEYFAKLEKRNEHQSRYNDPYYNMIYIYNEIVDDYNKFCELSKGTPHLKTIFQPELFTIVYPKEKSQTTTKRDSDLVANQTSSVPSKDENAVAKDKIEIKEQTEIKEQHGTRTTHTRDTIYIEKRDTVYIREPNEELRSMEGYATNNMVLLLDVSGSMNQPEKLPLLKESMLRMLSMMRSEDKISIIIFAAKPKVLLKAVSFKEEAKIKKAVADLSSSGKTDGNAALKAAYKLADANYVRGGNNRIIIATDGEFAIDDESKKLIEEFGSNDIFLSVFNFGKGMGSSKALENLAALGKGNYEGITRENVDVKLIKEAKAKRKK